MNKCIGFVAIVLQVEKSEYSFDSEKLREHSETQVCFLRMVIR